MGCCGGNVPASVPFFSANEGSKPGMVKIRYTGKSAGTMTFTNPETGGSYRAGANSMYEYFDAAPEDVKYLLGLGVFERVSTPEEVTESPSKQEREAAAKENAALAKAQADNLAAGGQVDSGQIVLEDEIPTRRIRSKKEE